MGFVERVEAMWSGRKVQIWTSPACRPPLSMLDARVGFETRRADLARQAFGAEADLGA